MNKSTFRVIGVALLIGFFLLFAILVHYLTGQQPLLRASESDLKNLDSEQLPTCNIEPAKRIGFRYENDLEERT